jgi:hypothetical protein
MSAFQDFCEAEEVHRWDGERGVQNLKDVCARINYSSLEEFLADNPGAIEAVTQWIDETATKSPDWQDCFKVEKTFHRTVISIEVLSEEPYDETDLRQIRQDIISGDCSGHVEVTSKEEVSEEEIKQLLRAQGSEPGFFGIDDDE